MKARNKQILITAGPTREFLDPVRFLSNPSSGKMGYAIAEAAMNLGCSVELVSGPSSLECPHGVNLHRVITAQEMLEVVARLFDFCNCSKNSSPQPIAAGIFNSEHLIAMCDATPPYIVIKPSIFFVKMDDHGITQNARTQV